MSNRFINHNGEILEADMPVATAANRSLRYGDGLFESMRWENGRLPLGDLHFERLFRGIGILQMEPADGFTQAYLSGQIGNLCERNRQQTARVRLNVYREDNPALAPVNNRPRFIIETGDLPLLRNEPLRVILYREEKKSTGILSNVKVSNHLLYILAARQAAIAGADEALILNSAGHICETSSSNIFFLGGGKIYTPALSEGCVAGVMRKQLLGRLPELGYVVEETSIPQEIPDHLEEAFITNAIRGLRPLATIGARPFGQRQTLDIIRRLSGSMFS